MSPPQSSCDKRLNHGCLNRFQETKSATYFDGTYNCGSAGFARKLIGFVYWPLPPRLKVETQILYLSPSELFGRLLFKSGMREAHRRRQHHYHYPLSYGNQNRSTQVGGQGGTAVRWHRRACRGWGHFG